MRPLLALLGCFGTVACSTGEPVIDPFPIRIDLDAGVPMLNVRSAELDQDHGPARVVLDTAAPLTVFDVGLTEPVRRRVTFDLLQAPLAGPEIPRARFLGLSVLLSAVGAVGDGTAHPIRGVIGGDVLTQLALRLEPAKGLIRFFPDIAGEDRQLAESCSASFATTVAGGGRYAIGSDDTLLPATRIVLSICLGAGPGAGSCAGMRRDTLLVLATGVRPTVLSRSTFKAATCMDDAAVDALPTTVLYLAGDRAPAGLTVHTARLDRFAIADRADHGDDNAGRGACLELRASRLMASNDPGGCTPEMLLPSDAGQPSCPCQNGKSRCAVGSSVEVLADLDVVIVEDTHPLLQSLREELRPAVADVGGLLGMQALAQLTTDIDYPRGRTIVRCATPGSNCVIRPAVSGTDEDEVRDRQSTLGDAGCLQPTTVP